MRSCAKRRISCAGHEVGRCRRIIVFNLDDAGGDLDEAQAQRVELSDAPHRAFRHRDAKSPHQPISAGVEEETELIGGRLRAGRAIRRQMVFQDLMWFSA